MRGVVGCAQRTPQRRQPPALTACPLRCSRAGSPSSFPRLGGPSVGMWRRRPRGALAADLRGYVRSQAEAWRALRQGKEVGAGAARGCRPHLRQGRGRKMRPLRPPPRPPPLPPRSAGRARGTWSRDSMRPSLARRCCGRTEGRRHCAEHTGSKVCFASGAAWAPPRFKAMSGSVSCALSIVSRGAWDHLREQGWVLCFRDLMTTRCLRTRSSVAARRFRLLRRRRRWESQTRPRRGGTCPSGARHGPPGRGGGTGCTQMVEAAATRQEASAAVDCRRGGKAPHLCG